MDKTLLSKVFKKIKQFNPKKTNDLLIYSLVKDVSRH